MFRRTAGELAHDRPSAVGVAASATRFAGRDRGDGHILVVCRDRAGACDPVHVCDILAVEEVGG
jgi:hypothetical protein